MPESTPARILIADDEPLFLRTTGELLRKAGFACVCVSDAPAALAALRREAFDLILTDLNMPGNLKLELLHEGREDFPAIPMIVITGVPSLPSAIESLRLGIADYLLKPIRFDELLASVRRVLAARAAAPATLPASGPAEADEIWIGDSPAMAELRQIAQRAAASDAHVLIRGESGVGKERLARWLHRQSRRRDRPLVVIDCTLDEPPWETLWPAGDDGVAFLDELGALSWLQQGKLLELARERGAATPPAEAAAAGRARLVSATTRDLLGDVQTGRFRRDLYYCLAVVEIHVPPLRQRGEDVLALARHFLAGANSPPFTAEALACLRGYSWPGNVRELRHAVASAAALAGAEPIAPEHLPAVVRAGSLAPSLTAPAAAPRVVALEQAEHDYLTGLLRENSGNVARSARQAGLSRQGLHKLLKKHGLDPQAFRPASPGPRAQNGGTG